MVVIAWRHRAGPRRVVGIERTPCRLWQREAVVVQSAVPGLVAADAGRVARAAAIGAPAQFAHRRRRACRAGDVSEVSALSRAEQWRLDRPGIASTGHACADAWPQAVATTRRQVTPDSHCASRRMAVGRLKAQRAGADTIHRNVW